MPEPVPDRSPDLRPDNPYAPACFPATAPCKCCGTAALPTGVTDLSRSGADIQFGLARHGLELAPEQVILDKLDPYWGMALYYYACPQCGFTFTPSLDHWTAADFDRYIYNDDYQRHDPGFGGERQEGWAEAFAGWFGAFRQDWAILDYGAGLGLFEDKLRARGFARVLSYDPFGADRALAPEPADLIFLNEVVEHMTDPAAGFAELASLRKPDGVIMLTTELCTPEILDRGVVNWWYCAPRSGHVSLFSEQALALFAQRHGLGYSRAGRSLHLLHGAQLPEWIPACFPHGWTVALP